MIKYQIFDTFYQKYIVEVRANGTLVFSKGLKESLPMKYSELKLDLNENGHERSIKLSNVHILDIP